jgi:dephospho-CoA kinase
VVEEEEDVRDRLREDFGDRFFASDGSLKREELGHFVFGDPERQKKLNALVHPGLLRRLHAAVGDARKRGAPLIVVDAALIYEVGVEGMFDRVVVVAADERRRIERLKARDGFREDEIRLRICAQMDLSEKMVRADMVIENNGTLAELDVRVREVYRQLTS